MRTWANGTVLAAASASLLLAGCAMPGDDDATATKDSLFGVCPQWALGPGQHAGIFGLDGNSKPEWIVPNQLTDSGRPFDLFRLTGDVHVNGTVSLRAFRADAEGKATTGLNVVDYREAKPRNLPTVAFDTDATDIILEVYLTPVDGKTPANPGGIVLEWQGEGGHADVNYQGSFHYRVCGASA